MTRVFATLQDTSDVRVFDATAMCRMYIIKQVIYIISFAKEN